MSSLLVLKYLEDNIVVVHKCFLPALSVILTKRSVGRISRKDLARDVCEMFAFPFGQRPKGSLRST